MHAAHQETRVEPPSPPDSTGRQDVGAAERLDDFARLADGVASEFGNLLTCILATTDLALASPQLPQELRSDLENIRESAKRAAQTTRQLLMFSRTATAQPRPTDLNELVVGLQPMLRRLLPANVNLEIQRAASGIVHVDPAQAEQVLINLVLNAADAMPNGGAVTITTSDITLHQVTHNYGRAVIPGEYVVLRVQDTGIGMDDATRQRIFDPYFTTKERRGAGLGLSSVHGIIQKAGGHIFVNSRPGAGTVFEICLPRATAAQVSPTSATQGIVVGGGEVILMIESSPTVRAPISRALRQVGYFLLEAKDGEEALRVLQEYHAPVHLVIADLSAPELNAAELVELLQGWYPQLKAVFVAPQDSGQTASQLPPGAALVTKPYTAKRLTLTVRSVLDGPQRVRLSANAIPKLS